MHDYSEQVALVGRGEHEHDDDESTVVPRKGSQETINGPWKQYAPTHR